MNRSTSIRALYETALDRGNRLVVVRRHCHSTPKKYRWELVERPAANQSGEKP